jgi:aminoglycoside phosphotransferase (APT) family kinase protein
VIVPADDSRHGFNEDAATRSLIRSPPLPDALEWVKTTMRTDVAGWTVLRGGLSSAMYRLDLSDRAAPPLVLRCYVRPDVNQEEPDLAAREAAALDVAARSELPTPELVAVDPDGLAAGVPLVLMSWLPGTIVWDPVAPSRWLARMAELLPGIHNAGPVGERVGSYFNYDQRSYAPPEWATDPGVWERAVGVFLGPVLDHERCFIHRDFHPGNLLWKRGRVTGVIDWQSACVGPPSADIGHCRANLLRYAPALADAFTKLAEQALCRTFHPWADIAALIGMLDGLRETPPRPVGRTAIEAALHHAVAALG